MKRNRYGRIAALVTAGVVALSACGNDPVADNGSDGGGGNEGSSDLSGKIAGAGATSMEAAQQAWIASFQSANPDVTVSYDPQGSGAGRTQFGEGAVQFAGSDSAMDDEERAAAKTTCGSEGIHLPIYISPIAVVYNLENVKELQLSPATVAKIFDKKITKWNDPAIAADNPDADLPDTAISPVNRSDESGTTKNFTEYLSKAAPEAWAHEPSGDWPLQGGQSANGTSGVVQAVQGGQGTIAYADHSQAGSLGVAKIKVGEKFVEPTAEGAAKVVEESPKKSGIPAGDLVIDLKRDTTTDGAYPVVLISYIIVCQKYKDAAQGELVSAYVNYMASADGQKVASEAAGSAPISDKLRTEIESSIKSIAGS